MKATVGMCVRLFLVDPATKGLDDKHPIAGIVVESSGGTALVVAFIPSLTSHRVWMTYAYTVGRDRGHVVADGCWLSVPQETP